MTNAELRKICEAGLPIPPKAGLKLLNRIDDLETKITAMIDHINKEIWGYDNEIQSCDSVEIGRGTGAELCIEEGSGKAPE